MRRLSARAGLQPMVARAVLSPVLALVLAMLLVVPDAEARRRRAHYAPYNPPFASIVYDVKSGRTLQATNADALRHPASVTKVMTLYMLFEQMETGRFKLDTELPVSREAASQAPSKIGLRPGDTIQVEDAIKALVTKSANDVAVVVAEAIGGDEERFAQMMTRKARAIGMSRTTFRNASGLPDPDQWTTARDLVTLGRQIQDRFPRYYPYFGTRMFTYEGRGYRNHNRLLGVVEGVDGIKTGYTRASGFNLLTSAKSEGRHIITVVLGGRSGRARDQQVAALIDEHMDRAQAGRRTAVAALDRVPEEDEDEKAAPPAPAPRAPVVAAAPALPAPRAAAQPLPLPSATPPAAAPQAIAALPPSRPRPAVIAEPAPRPPEPDSTANRPRPPAAINGSTSAVQAVTTPMAMLGTTPRSPALRWVPGPQGTEKPGAAEPRPVPPGSVRFTNAVPAEPPRAAENQPLPAPAAPIKVEERLGTAGRRAEPAPNAAPAPAPVAPLAVAAVPQAPAAPRVTAPEAPRPAPQAAAPAPKAAPQRTGWVIQIAAAESDAKARSVLANAVEKTGRLLKSAEPFTEAVEKGGATLYRARFAGFDADEAQAACRTLKRSGFQCIAQKI